MKQFIAGLWLLAAAHGAASGNLVQNPGFEGGGSGPEGWTLSSWGTPGIASWVSGQGADSSMAVLLECKGPKERASAAQFVKVDGAATLRLRVRCRGEKVEAGKAMVRLTFVAEKSDKTGSEFRFPLEPGPEWKQSVTNFSVPKGANFIRLDLFLYFGTGKLWFDEVGIESPEIPLPTERAFAKGNLLRNPGFEDGGAKPEGWMLSGWGTPARAQCVAGEGVGASHAARLEVDEDKGRASAAQFVEARAGGAYRIAGKIRGEGVAKGKAVFRATFLNASSDPGGPNRLIALDAKPDWSDFEAYFAVPADKQVLRLDFFLMYGKGKLWFDALELTEVEPSKIPKEGSVEVKGPSASVAERARAFAASESNAGPIRRSTLALFESNRKRAPKVFAQVFASVLERAQKFLEAPLKPVDMGTVVGRPYGSYNMDVWRLRGVAEELMALAQCWSIRDNPLHAKPEALRKIEASFAFLADHFSADGSTHAPDGNIDRFILIPLFESFFLCEHALTPATRERAANVLVQAAYYQADGYGKREGVGTYPNMDAAYLFIMQAAGMCFGEKRFLDEAALTIGYLGKCLSGGTWEYIQKWNPDPRYTKVVLEGVGRYWQLSGSAEAKRQLEAHRTYLSDFVEPGGLMDYGMSPFIKHDWTFTPFAAIGHGLDLINLVAPDPVVFGHVKRMRKYAESKPALLASPFLLYWLAPDEAPEAPAPTAFLKESREIEGFIMRHTAAPSGSGAPAAMTCYLTGKPISVDTRVSAICTPLDKPENASVFAGLFTEIVQDESIYYLGDMEPRIERKTGPDALSLTLEQKRHTLGPRVESLPFGGHMNSIKNWKFNCWKGGSPDGPPVLTRESWTLDRKAGLLRGEISLKAEKETTLEAVRLKAYFAPGGPSETKLAEKALFLRCGALCLRIKATQGAWKPTIEQTSFHFRIDVPDGEYEIALVSGDGNFPTEPFLVRVNGIDQGEPVSAAKGEFARRTFRAKAVAGSLKLLFIPATFGEHWKVNALSIQSKDGKFRRAFDVGPVYGALAAGCERLSGSQVYSEAKGFGWFRDLGSQERDRGLGDALTSDLITCGDGVETRTSFADGQKRAWKAGEACAATVVLGLGATLTAFEKQVEGVP